MAKVPELVAAAQAIETEQTRLEDLAQALHKTKLESEKHIARAQRELEGSLAQQEVLAGALRVLGAAMVNMQERQQVIVTALSVRAQEIQTRRVRLAEHMLGYAALGSKAAELLDTMQASLGDSDKAAAVTGADDKLAIIADEAAALAKTAREDDFTDVAHEADVLKQKFQQIRTQLGASRKAKS